MSSHAFNLLPLNEQCRFIDALYRDGTSEQKIRIKAKGSRGSGLFRFEGHGDKYEHEKRWWDDRIALIITTMKALTLDHTDPRRYDSPVKVMIQHRFDNLAQTALETYPVTPEITKSLLILLKEMRQVAVKVLSEPEMM